MSKILSSLPKTVIVGLMFSAILLVAYLKLQGGGFGHYESAFVLRWLHVLSGVMWIGLLWYFNFVQIPNMPNIPDEQKHPLKF